MAKKNKRKSAKPRVRAPRLSAREISLLNHARQLHEQGNGAAAEQSYRELIALNPNNAQALHFYAILALQTGRGDLAFDHISKAALLEPGDVGIQANRGEVLRSLGRHEEALEAYRIATRLAPEHPEVWNNAAGILFALGRFDEAERFARKTVKLAPRIPQGHLALAEILWAKADMSGVRDACNAVLSLEPNNAEAISRRAMGDAALGDAPGARQGLERALSIAPQLVPARLALVDLLVDAGELAEANGVLEPALGQSENDAEVAYRLGSLRHAQERYLEAVSPLQRVVDAIPEHWGAQMKLAWVEASTGDLDAGLRRLENVGAASASADPFVMMAQLEAMYGRTSLAQSHFETALSIDGENTAALRGHADTLVSAGEFAAAKVSLERAIACDPYDGYAYEALADISRRADWDGPAFARLVALGQDESNSPDSRAAALFGAARLEDGAGEYGSAFDWATQANALMGGLFPFDAPAHDAFAGRIMQVFSSSSHFDPGFGSDEARPLFIVGMPRSGTSLVEQVLASHSDVRAAGEVMFFDDVRFASGASYPEGCQELTLSDCGLLRERYLAKLQHAGLDRRYVTDKLPPNFLYLGFIRLLFPLSKIIHCRRDAMDTGVSLFFQNFTAAQGNAFTYSLEHIGSYTLTYRRLMQHWRSVLDPAPYEIDYEAIISDPERSIRGLLDYLELDWEDACLSFHQTKRDVLTASRVQVRQPLYNSSVARSARYGDGLAPLRQLIGSSHD